MKLKALGVSLILASVSILSACSSDDNVKKDTTAEENGHEQGRIDAMVEETLQGLNTGDYVSFNKYFSEDMFTYFPETEFDKFYQTIKETSGPYVSKVFTTAYSDSKSGFAAYVYGTEFEKEPVVVTVSFKLNSYAVEGFFVDSQNLRAAMEAKK